MDARKRSLVCFALALAFGVALRANGLESLSGPPIVLPTFTITAELVGYDQEEGWRYCSLPGLEVLAKGSERDHTKILREFLLFRGALESVWPNTLTSDQLPVILVFCNDSSSFDKFFFNNKTAAPSRRSRTSPTRGLSEGDEAIIVQLASGDASVGAAMVERTYVSAILGRIEKHSAPWLKRGLEKAFTGMSFSKGKFHFPALTSDKTLRIRRAGTVDDLERALTEGTFFTLEQLFSAEKAPANEVPGSGIRKDEMLSKFFAGPWSNECYEFVHLCLFGADGKYREPFLQLADLSAKQPIDEPTFRSLFGMGFRDMLLVLWRYTDWGDSTTFKVGQDKDDALAALPPMEFRDATDAEFSRIRGEALLAGKWFGAHYAFIAAYQRGARDPELLASLGIQEALFDKDERALKFLEAAAAARTTRARAYAELARLRCKAAFAKPEGEGGKLTPGQMQSVFEPLSSAFKLPPALPLPYQVLTALWSEAAIRPTLADLSVIRQGVERFPFDSDLTYNAAALYLKHGYIGEATSLVEFGLRMARNDNVRARFVDLRASLTPK